MARIHTIAFSAPLTDGTDFFSTKPPTQAADSGGTRIGLETTN
jgi:hypothetical protein